MVQNIRTTPTPQTMQGYTFRPARLDDAPAILRLYVAMDLADGTTWAGSLEETRHDFEDPNNDPAQDTLLAITPEGEIAGLAWIFLPSQAEKAHQAYLWGGIHPDHRRRGLGSAVLEWSIQRCTQRLAAFDDGLPGVMRVNCPDTAVDRIALIEKHHFHQVRYYYRMRRDLSLPIPEVPLPPGVRLQAWSPTVDAQAYEVINAAFRDHWGTEPMAPDSWKQNVVESDSFRPELTFLAFDDGQIAGASINRVHAEDNARVGINEGWIGSLGVLREQRGRGLGKALLVHSMRAFKAQGMQAAGLFVDTENLTGALKLYEHLGFTVVMRTIAWEFNPSLDENGIRKEN